MKIRDAKRADAARIARIVNQAKETPGVIWRPDPVTPEEAEAWIAGPARRAALLVAVDEGDAALGFAALGRFKPTAGWERCAEISIYVSAAFRGRQLGEALCAELTPRAAALGFQTIISAIDASNTASIRFHERLGFEQIGVMRQAGIEGDTERDVVLLQFLLASSIAP